MNIKNIMVKLSNEDADKVLRHMRVDELSDEYRKECFVEIENGETIENWFVGDNGAKSYSGKILPLDEWKEKVQSKRAE